MKIEHNLDLTEYNSYKVHSVAAVALFPESVSDFIEILNNYDISSCHIV